MWTIVAVLFLGGVQLISVGILGRYLARVHDQTLGRPLYLVDWVKHGGAVPTAPAPTGTRDTRRVARSLRRPGTGRRARSAARAVTRRGRALWPLGLYTLLSLLMFGLPVIGHLGSRIVASDPIDSSQFMWFLAWWPHALLHGLQPVRDARDVRSRRLQPDLVHGDAPAPRSCSRRSPNCSDEVATWNVIQLASPALSAWTMFLLCRHTGGRGRRWPAGTCSASRPTC